MAKLDFLPHSDGQFLIWHDQNKTSVTAQAATFGLSSAQIALLAADNTELHTRVAGAAAATATAQQANADKDACRRKVEQHSRALARQLKAHASYTPAFGNQFGIEGADGADELSAANQVLTSTAQKGGVVVIDFVKSKSDGVNLYSRRGAESEFTFLARDTSSPYIDNRPPLVAGQPELRHYQAVYVLGDDEVGQPSGEITVTTLP